MHETRRTLVYCGTAALFVALALALWSSNRPVTGVEFERIGQEFFPDFNDPLKATSLTVFGFDEEKAAIREFRVQKEGTRWVIPSHYGYPTDATDRLGKTAASIIGIRRGALASRLESDHERYGVIDPALTDVTSLKGRGSRITIQAGDQILADYIVGKQAATAQGRYYVRVPGEKETYIADFNPDLSTSFADWIDVDLIKLDQDKLTSLVVDKYTLDEQAGALKDRQVSILERDKFGDPWKLSDLDPEQEEVNTQAVNDLIRALTGLKIQGVRPKPQGLNPDLSFDPAIVRNQLVFETIQRDLIGKGFFLIQRRNEEGLGLVAQEGSFHAGMNDGVVYDLHFGEIFTGNLSEIEIGKPADAEEGEAAAEPSASAADPFGTKPQSRYVFVKVSYDPAYLGPAPQKPIEPTPPETPDAPKNDAPQSPSESEQTPDDNSGGTLAADEGAVVEDVEMPLAAPKPEGVTAPGKSADPVAEYNILKAQYDAALKQYEIDLKDYEKRKTDGQARSVELNERLGAWYYVVPAESIQNLRLDRSSFVKPKSAAPDSDDDTLGLPGIPDALKLND